jgi:hypothetical protein
MFGRTLSQIFKLAGFGGEVPGSQEIIDLGIHRHQVPNMARAVGLSALLTLSINDKKAKAEKLRMVMMAGAVVVMVTVPVAVPQT